MQNYALSTLIFWAVLVVLLFGAIGCTTNEPCTTLACVKQGAQKEADSRGEIGKSVSLSSLEQVEREFTDSKTLDTLQLVAILSAVPEDIREMLIDPYASPHSGELRISSRIHETGPPFSRDELIKDIERFAVDELGLSEGGGSRCYL